MVYHIPGQEPLGNSGWLGPLRVFTCDEAAARFVQRGLLAVVRATLISYGVRHVCNAWEKNLPNWAPALLSKITGDRLLPASRKSALCGAAALLAVAVADSALKWHRHMKRVEPTSNKFFWHTDSEGNAPPAAQGILFYAKPANLPPDATPADVKTVMVNKKWNRWYTWPIISQDRGYVRAFNVTGLNLLPYLAIDLTTGFEYPARAVCRIIQRLCWMPRWNKPKADRRLLYRAVMNTSYACFIDFEVGSETFGHAVLDNILLPYAQTSIKKVSRMIIHLDHEREVVLKVEIHPKDNDKLHHVEVYGSEIDGENTYNTDPELTKDGITITPLQNLEQAAMLMIVVIALYNHGLVHGWANGTACLPDGVWAHRDASTNLTNWMNSQAVLGTYRFFGGITMETLGHICVHNVMQGLPHHGTRGASTALMKLVASRSTFHQMTMRVRIRLLDHFTGACARDGTAMPEIEAIAAATVMHSAEHFYAGKFMPLFGTNGSVMALKTDISGLTQSLIAPVSYSARAYLCKEHLADPVCRTIFDVCNCIDSEFAQTALAIGCAY